MGDRILKVIDSNEHSCRRQVSRPKSRHHLGLLMRASVIPYPTGLRNCVLQLVSW